MDEKMLRHNLGEMLGDGAAHIGIERALEGFPVDRAGEGVKSPRGFWNSRCGVGYHIET